MFFLVLAPPPPLPLLPLLLLPLLFSFHGAWDVNNVSKVGLKVYLSDEVNVEVYQEVDLEVKLDIHVPFHFSNRTLIPGVYPDLTWFNTIFQYICSFPTSHVLFLEIADKNAEFFLEFQVVNNRVWTGPKSGPVEGNRLVWLKLFSVDRSFYRNEQRCWDASVYMLDPAERHYSNGRPLSMLYWVLRVNQTTMSVVIIESYGCMFSLSYSAISRNTRLAIYG